MITRSIAALALSSLVLVSAFGGTVEESPQIAYEDVQALSLENLEPLPPDPSNRWADDPAAAALGEKLFFDVRLSGNGQVSCATCHIPERDFQDGIPLGKGVGTASRRTMPLAGVAYAPFLFWDGRKDSLWAQALGPLENPEEHGGDRAEHARVVATYYRDEYSRVFGELPALEGSDSVTQVFVNVGKAIAAYERTIQFQPSRFDRFASEWKSSGAMPKDVLDIAEIAGLALFLGKANCTQCHNGPLFTNNEFHNTGVPARGGVPMDHGRAAAIVQVKADEFNCRSRWSDAKGQCRELDFLAPAAAHNKRAFKVPSLRNVAGRAPYMHAGQFSTLAAVLDHYSRAPHEMPGASEIRPLALNQGEINQLDAFLRTLSGQSQVRIQIQ